MSLTSKQEIVKTNQTTNSLSDALSVTSNQQADNSGDTKGELADHASITFLNFKKVDLECCPTREESIPEDEKQFHIIILSKMFSDGNKNKLDLSLSFFACYNSCDQRIVCHMEEGDHSKKLKEDVSVYPLSKENTQYLFVELKEFHRQVKMISIYKNLAAPIVKVAHVFLGRDWLLPKGYLQKFLEPICDVIAQGDSQNVLGVYYAYIKPCFQIPKDEQIIFKYSDAGLYFPKNPAKKDPPYSLDVVTETINGLIRDHYHISTIHDTIMESKSEVLGSTLKTREFIEKELYPVSFSKPFLKKRSSTVQIDELRPKIFNRENSQLGEICDSSPIFNGILTTRSELTNLLSKETQTSPQIQQAESPSFEPISENESVIIRQFDYEYRSTIPKESEKKNFRLNFYNQEEIQTRDTQKLNRAKNDYQLGIEDRKLTQSTISAKTQNINSLNLVLWCLFNVPPFAQQLQKHYDEPEKSKRPSLYILNQLIKKNKFYSKNSLQQSSLETYDESLSELYQLISEATPSFEIDKHLAVELFKVILEILIEELNWREESQIYSCLNTTLGNEDPEYGNQIIKSRSLKENTSIIDLFRGQLAFASICNQCKSQKKSMDNFWTLSLEFKETQNSSEAYILTNMVKDLFEQELIEGTDFCENCNLRCDIRSKTEIDKLPDVLIIDFEKYHQSLKLGTQKEVVFPIERLDLSNLIKASCNSSGDSMYSLFGILNKNDDLSSVIYTADCRNLSNRQWFHFDGSSVQPNQLKFINEEYCCSPCVLIYIKGSSIEEEDSIRRTRKFERRISGKELADFRETLNIYKMRKHKRNNSEVPSSYKKNIAENERPTIKERDAPCGCF